MVTGSLGRTSGDPGDLQHDIYLAALQLNSPISLQETVNALRATKNGKALGIDNVANEILRLPALHDVLHKLYQKCFETNMIPSTWYKAIIHPILKKGKDPLFPLSHRGISLMSTIAKVFSSILNKRLTDFLETNRIYAEEQNGFRRLRSCLDHLYALTTVIPNRKLLKLDTYCAFVDFETAFDSVEYPFLWYKMLASGIHGKMLKIIQTMYANLQNCVRVGGRLTDWFSQSAGVRQGDALAPTLFALFINDLVPEINGLSCGVPMSDDKFLSILLYADDIVLISGTTEGLQKQLDGLNDWSSGWKLRVNTDKTNVVHFRRTSDTTNDHVFTLGNSPLITESSYRYLGMDIKDRLDFNHSVDVLSYSAGRALGAMTSKYYQADGLDYDTYAEMYESLVTPIMDYGCEIWGYKERGRCDVVQHRALRTFRGVGKCTPLPMLYIDMARTPSHVRQQSAMVRYWRRLCPLPRNRIAETIFEWDHDLAGQGHHTWSWDVQKVLECAAASPEIFEARSPGPGDLVERTRSALWKIDLQRRHEDMASMSRLDFYRDVIGNTPMTAQEPVEYVKWPLQRQQRAVLARLRSGTLRLSVETGLYRNIDAAHRLCKQCDMDTVDRDCISFLI